MFLLDFLAPAIFIIVYWAAQISIILIILTFSKSNVSHIFAQIRRRFLGKHYSSELSIWLIACALLTVGLIGLNEDSGWFKDLAPEMIGISVTILIIDSLYNFRLEQHEKQHILEQLASHSNEFALEATRIARKRDWIVDGTLRKVDLSKANLADADLSQANLQETNLYGANLQRAWLSSESDGYWLQSQMLPFFLSDISRRGANLRGANLSRADLRGARLAKADLENAVLEFADLANASLIGANLRGTNLWGATLLETDLRSADLSESNLCSAIIVNVICDEQTVWPKDFVPTPEQLKYGSNNIT